MKCLEENCNGRIDKQYTISLKTTSTGWGGTYSQAYVCEKCGRLYWKNGKPVFYRKLCWKNGKPVFNISKHKAFLKNKKLVLEKS